MTSHPTVTPESVTATPGHTPQGPVVTPADPVAAALESAGPGATVKAKIAAVCDVVGNPEVMPKEVMELLAGHLDPAPTRETVQRAVSTWRKTQEPGVTATPGHTPQAVPVTPITRGHSVTVTPKEGQSKAVASVDDEGQNERTADLPKLTPDVEARFAAELEAIASIRESVAVTPGQTPHTVTVTPEITPEDVTVTPSAAGHTGPVTPGHTAAATRSHPVTPKPAGHTAAVTPPADGHTEPVTPSATGHTVTAAPSQPVTPGHTSSAEAVTPPKGKRRPLRVWPVLLLALPAFVAIWSGWVGLGGMCGFGLVRPLPGIADGIQINTAITLPIGMETYAAYALYVWLSGKAHSATTRNYAKWSAFGSLLLGAAGQVAYHLMQAAGIVHAPWWITTVVACIPVAVLGMGAALAHMIAGEREHVTSKEAEPQE